MRFPNAAFRKAVNTASDISPEGHRELSVLDLAEAADIATYPYVIGRIDEDHFRLLAVQQVVK